MHDEKNRLSKRRADREIIDFTPVQADPGDEGVRGKSFPPAAGGK
jgi:hypothetical protein